MEDSWLLTTPILLNANTPTLEIKEAKTQTELFIVIDEIKDTLEHFGKKLEQQKEGSSNRINQLEVCLTRTLDEFAQYIQHAIPAYTDKEEIGMLKYEIKALKEETNKLKPDMSEKEILINSLTGKLNDERAKQIWQAETRQNETRKYPFRQNVSLKTKNRFVLFQNTQDKVLDKEAKNYKEKKNIATPSSDTSIWQAKSSC